MTKEVYMKKTANSRDDGNHWKNMRGGQASGAVYGMGFLGAVIYFISHATSFGMGVLGFLKAMIWPVLLVYKLLELLKM
jgi:hypothetical protein